MLKLVHRTFSEGQAVIDRNPIPALLSSRLPVIAAGLFACVLSGCQNWPQSQRAMQQQIESERLLSEFRAQKKRADDLESRNKQLSERLSESEKMLARLQSSSPSSGRLAARGTDTSFGSPTARNRTIEQYASEFQSQMSQTTAANHRPGGSAPSTIPADQPVWRPLSRP